MSRNTLSQWYATLTPRDQRVLSIGALVMLLIVLLWVFLPLQQSLGKARAELQTRRDDLEWMQQMAPTLAAAGPGPVAATTPENLVVLIDTSLRESGLAQALTGSVPVNDGSLRVQLENADFNLVTGWISRLSSQHGVQVVAASFTGNESPGVVNASVQLRTR